MKVIYKTVAVAMLANLLLPAIGVAAQTKTLSGTITKISGSQIAFMAVSAASYSADIANAQLIRKNGSPMQFSEFLVGDKVEVKGTLWADNSISAASIRDTSLYAHNSTFSAKIITINPQDSSFIMQSKTYGSQTIHTNNLTSFSANGKSGGFKDLVLGMSMKVKGMWDRSRSDVIATTVEGHFRLISINFTGTLSMKNGSGLTVIGNGNVIYGVDASNATFQNKSSQPITLSQLKLGDSLRVWGKHISGSVQIVGTKIKDSSVIK